MSRYRITVRGEGIELRGYFDHTPLNKLNDFAEAMKPYGVVVASPVDPNYNPFIPLPETEDSQI